MVILNERIGEHLVTLARHDIIARAALGGISIRTHRDQKSVKNDIENKIGLMDKILKEAKSMQR